MSNHPQEVATEYRTIRADYAYNPDIMCDEDERVRRVKEIMDTRLSPADRIIITLYAELQSYRKLGKRMGLSHMTARSQVMRIREYILSELGKRSS